jgi:hypothetical protein
LISLKNGVDLRGMRPEIVLAAVIAETVYAAHGKDFVITAAVDGQHMKGSLHYSGNAIDVRTTACGLSADQSCAIGKEVAHALGPQFDVVVENDHIHIEFDPKEAKA